MSSFQDATNKLEGLLSDDKILHQDRLYLDEALSRLKRIESQYLEIVNLNNEYLDADQQVLEMREYFNSPALFEMLKKQSEIDGNLKKWFDSNSGNMQISSKTEIKTFNLSEEVEEKISALHSKTESLYNELWLIKERLNKVDKFKNFNPAGVRDVRNQLIVHIDKPNSKATIFSFGIQTNGPVLRPVKPSTATANHDNGLVVNVESFLSAIVNI
jgi:hypothetical protein